MVNFYQCKNHKSSQMLPGVLIPSYLFVLLQLMCTVEDLKEMGIPLGPRKKIAKFVKERVNKQVGTLADCHPRRTNRLHT